MKEQERDLLNINGKSFKWVKVAQNDVAHNNGVYVFACAGDNHILFEIHRLEKGERLWKHFEGGPAPCRWAFPDR